MNPLKKIFNLISQVLFGNVVSSLIFAVFFILATRKASPRELGIFCTTYAIALFIADLADFGTGTLAITRAQSRSPIYTQEVIRGYATGRFYIFLIFGILITPIGIFSGHELLCFLIVLTSFLLSIKILLLTEQRALRKYSQFNLTLILERLFSLIILMSLGETTAEKLMLAVLISNFVIILVYRWKPDFFYDFRKLKEEYLAARHLGLSSIASDLALLDVPILAFIASAAVSGEYAVALRISTPVLIIASVLGTVLVRELGEDIVDRRTLRLMIVKISLITSLALAFIEFLLIWKTQLIVKLFAGSQYFGINFLVILVSIASCIAVLKGLIASVLQVRGNFKFLGIWNTLTGGLYLFIIFVSAGKTGANSLPAASIISSIIFIFASLVILKKSNYPQNVKSDV